VGKSPSCHKLGLGVREIRVGAGTARTGADVMACGAGAAGPAPDVRHQPTGISKPKIRISHVIPKTSRISQLIPKKTQGYPKLSPKKNFKKGYPFLERKKSGYPCIVQDIPFYWFIFRDIPMSGISQQKLAIFGSAQDILTYTILIPRVYFPHEESTPVG